MLLLERKWNNRPAIHLPEDSSTYSTRKEKEREGETERERERELDRERKL